MTQLHELLSVVASYYGFTPAEVIGGGRYRKYSHARNVFYYVARERYPHLSYADIGMAVSRNFRSAWKGRQAMLDILLTERQSATDIVAIQGIVNERGYENMTFSGCLPMLPK